MLVLSIFYLILSCPIERFTHVLRNGVEVCICWLGAVAAALYDFLRHMAVEDGPIYRSFTEIKNDAFIFNLNTMWPILVKFPDLYVLGIVRPK